MQECKPHAADVGCPAHGLSRLISISSVGLPNFSTASEMKLKVSHFSQPRWARHCSQSKRARCGPLELPTVACAQLQYLQRSKIRTQSPTNGLSVVSLVNPLSLNKSSMPLNPQAALVLDTRPPSRCARAPRLTVRNASELEGLP